MKIQHLKAKKKEQSAQIHQQSKNLSSKHGSVKELTEQVMQLKVANDDLIEDKDTLLSINEKTITARKRETYTK